MVTVPSAGTADSAARFCSAASIHTSGLVQEVFSDKATLLATTLCMGQAAGVLAWAQA